MQVKHMCFLYLFLLAAFVALVDGKGGGKASSGSNNGQGSKGRRPNFVKNGNHTECRDPYTNRVVRCPSSNKSKIIAGGVIGGAAGLILIGALVLWCRRRHNTGRSATRSLNVPVMSSQECKEYKHLDSSPSESTSQSKVGSV
ncbi:hypothetical protein Ac2012v2_004746 [Leucoagaricus gongylophorus]